MPSAITLHPPSAPLRGCVTLPGSKSITNRALLLAALAKGRSRLRGALKSDDTRYMADALRRCGAIVDEPDATTFLVTGTGRLQSPAVPLFVGNAGTAARFLTAAAATIAGETVIDGDAHMRRRPIAPLLAALRALGVGAQAQSGCPPVIVRSQGIEGGSVSIDAGLSSQYVSALLMAAACGRQATELTLIGPDIGARGYIDLTLAVMRRFGGRADARVEGRWTIDATGYRAADLEIEPDASAATYLWAAEALTNGTIDLSHAASAFSQPDAAAHRIIARYPHLPPVIDGSQIQDAIPTLATLAALNAGTVRFTGIANLRVKECDRVRAIATELCRIRPGLAREEGDDLIVDGDPEMAGRWLPATIETYSDHRIAMSFALLGLGIRGITIRDPDCVAKTYPGYWSALTSLGVEITSLP